MQTLTESTERSTEPDRRSGVDDFAAPAGRATVSHTRRTEEPPVDDPWIGSPRDPAAVLRPYIRLVQRYRLILVAAIAVSVVFTAVRFTIQDRVYLAKATLLPSGGQGGGAGVLGLLASVTGAPPMLGSAEENSSILFPRIVESRRVGLEVLKTRFRIASRGGVEMTLQEFFESETDDEALLGLKGIRAVDVDKETGMISISVTTPDADLSAQIANRFVDVLEGVNSELRRASATQNSSFLQERMAEMRAELTSAEDRLTRFREENMRMNAPELELERLRLERDVAMRSQIYISLSSQAELARIEEAKNLPIVRVLERASVPNLPVPVPRVALLIGACLAGLVIGLALVAGFETLKFLRAATRAA